MFRKILIANRGEIALRIIRCCREMGIETVAIYSTADESALHVQMATQAICVGGPKPGESYLNMRNILSAAICSGCDAIHPGFGFLSENSEFARLCQECGIIFIGPSEEVIEKMGNKSQARKLMIANDIPVVPGSQGSIANAEEAKIIAQKIGYPVLIKAAAGGGGRGMRTALNQEETEQAFNTAQAEAQACFDDGEMYIEKLILNPKHIEFQILGDSHGNTIHLGERDCSIQRKNQKMMEEAPSKALSPQLREKMGATAVKAAKAANYTNAGTIEFVLDQQGNYYFIEMNTRIQVEHPITEILTGVDLVKEQIRISAGLSLEYKQEDITYHGHSLECRINAENPMADFCPCPGTINFLHLPGGNGTRVDAAIYNGYEISPFYDSMIAKIIVNAPTRLGAIRKMRRALEEMVIEGITTNLEIEHLILFHPEFMKGTYNTGFIENNLDELLKLAKKI
ncbi:MAG: acetyl-CoA carboxylase biotin carboxylase subunit [Clostridiales bacterium]